MSKMYKKRKRGRAPIVIFILIIILGILLYFNFKGNNIKLSKEERVLIIGKQNVFAVYEDKLAIKIPFEINLNDKETLGELVETKNYEKVLEKINDIMPEKINRFVVINTGNQKIDAEYEKNIPETNIGDKRMILTSSVSSMFNEIYIEKKSKNEINENILVDVLNANGKGGYARRTGEKISKDLGMKYNAANYETQLNESYVILNDISKEKVLEILEKLPEKYFKIKSKSTIPTLANVVLILGKEDDVDLKIEIDASKEIYENTKNTLKNKGYRNITNNKTDNKIEHSVIEYNKEDYFIALKLSKILGIQDMLVLDTLNNKINIIIK